MLDADGNPYKVETVRDPFFGIALYKRRKVTKVDMSQFEAAEMVYSEEYKVWYKKGVEDPKEKVEAAKRKSLESLNKLKSRKRPSNPPTAAKAPESKPSLSKPPPEPADAPPTPAAPEPPRPKIKVELPDPIDISDASNPPTPAKA